MTLGKAKVRKTILALSGFALLTSLFYLRVLSGEFTLFGGFDNSVQFYAWFQFASQSIHTGVFPLWDPMQFAGRTFIGEAQTGIFYPLNLILVLLFGSKEGIPLFPLEAGLMIGSFFAAVSMFYCCRKLGLQHFPATVAGIIFAFTGFLSTRMLGQVGVFNAAIWLPLVFLLYLKAHEEQRLLRSLFWSALSGASLAMSFLAGHIQPLLLIYLFLVFFSFYQFVTAGNFTVHSGIRSLAQLAMAALMVVLIGGIQLFPSLEYNQLAVRWVGGDAPIWPGEPVPYSVLKEFQLSASGLLGFFVPRVFPSQEGHPYFGILPLALLFVGVFFLQVRTSLFFYLVCLLSLLYALGTNSPFHDFLFHNVPFLDKIRAPIRALYLFHFAAAIVSGFALQGLFSTLSDEFRKRLARSLRTILFAALVGTLATISIVIYFRFSPAAIVEGKLGHILISFLFLAGSSMLIWMFLRARISKRAFIVLACSLLLLDTFSYSPLLFPIRTATLVRHNNYPDSPVLDFFKRDTTLYRVDVHGGALLPNSGDVFGIQCLMGHAASMEANYFRFRSECWKPEDPLYRLLNVKYIITKDEISGYNKVVDGEIKLYQLNPLPRIWHAERVAVIADDLEAYKTLKSPGFDLAREAIVHAPLPIALKYPPKKIQYAVTEYSPNRIVISCSSDSPALIILSEKYYPGWKCTINGRPSAIIRTDGIFRGIIVPEGSSEVVLTYVPGTVRLGLFTLGAGVVILFTLGISLRKKPSEHHAAHH